MTAQRARTSSANMPVVMPTPAPGRILEASRGLAGLDVIGLLNVEMAHPKATFEPVLTALAADPSLASFVIQAACSAHFGGRANSCTLTEAFARLGVTEFCRQLVTAVVQLKICKQRFPKCTAHAEEVGRLCELIAAVSAKELRLAAYCTGVCHDAGVPVIFDAVTDYRYLADRALANDPEVLPLERGCAGVSHCDVSAELVATMGFAASVAAAVRLHHEPDRLCQLTGESARLLSMLIIAERVIGVVVGDVEAVFEKLVEDELRQHCLQALDLESDRLDATIVELLTWCRARHRLG